jgi:sentrin-specific protease 8
MRNTLDPQELQELCTRDFHLDEAQYVFFPLNNHRGRMISGGSHWSLLVFDKINNSFYYYDSLHGFNRPIAEALVNKISRFLSPLYSMWISYYDKTLSKELIRCR